MNAADSAAVDIVAALIAMAPAVRTEALAQLAPVEREALDRAWAAWAHAGQLAPAACDDGAPWSTWVLMAGRGFGKTLAGAQWITAAIDRQPALSIALVGASLDDARRVMVEGRSGLLTVAAPWIERWEPSRGRLSFTNGSTATIFSGASPDLLRGPEHHLAWCDELAKWPKAQGCWDVLQMGLRLGERPRALVTTTPGRAAVLRAIMAAPDTVVTRGSTTANPHLSAAWQARMVAQYGGTRLGRQELDGELLPEAGALWSPELIEGCRVLERPPACGRGLGEGAPPATEYQVESGGPPPSIGSKRPPGVSETCRGHVSPDRSLPQAGGGGYVRTLVAVDPPVGDGTCGIVACARDAAGLIHILADHSVTARSPEGWARAVADACALHGTRGVVAEANQGGRMVKAVLLAANAGLAVRLVNASASKSHRAEPVAQLFEAGKARLHGRMVELEAQLCGLIAGGGYEGPGASPDRADAMVWAVSELMRGRGEARVRGV